MTLPKLDSLYGTKIQMNWDIELREQMEQAVRVEHPVLQVAQELLVLREQAEVQGHLEHQARQGIHLLMALRPFLLR
jgi:hypothetical protein